MFIVSGGKKKLSVLRAISIGLLAESRATGHQNRGSKNFLVRESLSSLS
jgi:hypothetical protein